MRVTVSNAQRFVGWFAVALAITVAALGYVSQQNDNNRAACQTRVNQEFLAVIKQRAALSTESTANIDALIVSVFADKTPQQAQADYAKYKARLDTINGELKRATFPSIGSC